jgi:outer membrane protein TolC
MPSRTLRWGLLLILAGSHCHCLAAPLAFPAALELAQRGSPTLAAGAARVGSARSSSLAADALPDPKLVAGMDNLAVSGPGRWQPGSEPMTMERIGLMQEFPSADKRRARRDVALADIGIALAQERFARIQVRREAALAWLERYYAERRLAVLGDLEQENRLLEAIVRAQTSAGRSQAVDVLLARAEQVLLADRRDDLVRDVARATAGLRRLVGDAAGEALGGVPPEFPFDPADLRRHVHAHPEIGVFDAQAQQGAALVREARSSKRSDWGVALDFQRRSPQFGNMVSVQFTFDLPFFPGHRQDPAIAARELDLQRIGAEREAMLRDHSFALEAALADQAALARQFDRARGSAIALAQERVDLLEAGYRAGKGGIAALLAARRDLLDGRMKVVDLEGRLAAASAAIVISFGEDLQ